MNIIVLEDSSKSMFGGGQAVTLSVMKVMLNLNYDIHLFDTHQNSSFKNKAKPLCSNLLSIYTYGKIKKGTTASFNFSFFEVLVFPFLLMINLFNIFFYIRKYKINKNNTILYATTKKALCYAFILNCLGFKFIYHAHNYDNKSRYTKVFKLLLSKAFRVLCVSKKVRDSLKIDNSLLLYNSIDSPPVEHERSLNYSRNINIAFIGSLIELKGVEYFLKSKSYLDEKRFNFHVFGDGELKCELEYKYGYFAKFHGFVDSKDIIKEYDLDIIILPSILEEACPMVIIESFSKAVPVITTNIGGQAELVTSGESGILVEPNCSEMIASAAELIAHEGNYSNYSRSAMKSFSKFSYTVFENILKSTLDEVFDEVGTLK